MPSPVFKTLEIGDELPSLTVPPITRQTLAIYCGASGDHNPVHVDIDFARTAGLDDVLAHGMLIMAYMSRCLTDWITPEAIRSFDTRFMAITRVGDQITCEARVIEKLLHNGEQRVRVAVTARDQRGEIKTHGEAVLALA